MIGGKLLAEVGRADATVAIQSAGIAQGIWHVTGSGDHSEGVGHVATPDLACWGPGKDIERQPVCRGQTLGGVLSRVSRWESPCLSSATGKYGGKSARQGKDRALDSRH